MRKRNLRTLGILGVILGATLCSVMAEAGVSGGESSGGGNAVVCFDHRAIADQVRANGGVIQDTDLEHITFIEMVDLYQARRPRGLPPKTPELVPINEDLAIDDGVAISEYFGKLQRRFQHVSTRVTQMLEFMNTVLGEEVFRFHANAVHQMRDADLEIELESPACTFTTMAYNEIINADLVYIHIDQRLFNLVTPKVTHSRMSKGVLLLHEFFYVMARFMNQDTTSKKTRDFINYLITQKTGVKVSRFMEIASALGFNIRPEEDYLFSKDSIGLFWLPEYAAYPYYQALAFTAGAFQGGETNMTSAYFSYESKLGLSDPLFARTGELFRKYRYENVRITSLEGVVVALDAALGSGSNNLPRIPDLSTEDRLELQELRNRGRDHLWKRLQLMKEAGRTLFESRYRQGFLDIPYISTEDKERIVQAALQTVDLLADKSLSLSTVVEEKITDPTTGRETIIYAGTSEFRDGIFNHDRTKEHLVKKVIAYGHYNFIRKLLEVELPSVN